MPGLSKSPSHRNDVRAAVAALSGSPLTAAKSSTSNVSRET